MQIILAFSTQTLIKEHTREPLKDSIQPEKKVQSEQNSAEPKIRSEIGPWFGLYVTCARLNTLV